MINPMGLFKLKGIYEQLTRAHPKLIPFVRDVYPAAIGEGSLIDIRVTDPRGKVYHYNMILSAEDMAAIEEVSKFAGDVDGMDIPQ